MKPIAVVFHLPKSPLPKAVCVGYLVTKNKAPHLHALPDVEETPHGDAMDAAIDEVLSGVQHEVFSDDGFEAAKTIQWRQAYLPLVDDQRTVQQALIADGFDVVLLGQKAPRSTKTDAQVTALIAGLERRLSLSSLKLVLGVSGPHDQRDDLPFHAQRVADAIAVGLGSQKFISQLRRTASKWSTARRDTFLAIAAHALLVPVIETQTPKQAGAEVKQIDALLAAVPPSKSKAIVAEVTRWKAWKTLTLAAELKRFTQSKIGKRAGPLTAADLAKIVKTEGPMPADLRVLYAVAGNLSTLLKNESIEWLTPVEAAEAHSNALSARAPKSLYPFATDGAGNFACIDLKTSQIVDWDHETRESTLIAPSLASYVWQTFPMR